MPSPAAAALVVGLVWVATDLREARWITSTAAELAWLAWVVTVYAGITMVASVPFYSFKDLNFRRAVPFIFILLLVAGFVLISSDPPTMLFLLFVVYGLSGYVLWGWRHWRGIPSPVVKSAAATASASAGSGAGSAGASPVPEPPGMPSDHRGSSPHSGAASTPDGASPRVSPGESPGPPSGG